VAAYVRSLLVSVCCTVRQETVLVYCMFSLVRFVHKIAKVLFIHQLMHQSVVLKNNIKVYIKTAPTCFGVTVTPSSGSALICA